ncbi:MAG: hypothetical protein M3N53_06930 [Actinomycetota bacterium]|nr:hypothetical protein [Actinomycetota bacterium]
MKRLRAIWDSLAGDADRRVRLGRLLGLVFMTAGFVVIGFAWEGSASINFVQGQMPYLLSGGFMGLGLIVTGATLLLLATVRSEREVTSKQFDEMLRLLGRNLNRLSISSNGAGAAGVNGQVVAGATAFHRAECKVLEGKEGLSTVTVEQAEAEGLTPCRVCSPPHTERKEEPAPTSANGGKTEVLTPASDGGASSGSEKPTP